MSDREPPPLEAILESLLFVAEGPVEVSALAKATEAKPSQVAKALEALALALRGRGVRVQHTGDQVQLVTAPECAGYVERFLGLEADNRLSAAALETLAIIAYRQPVSRPAIEAIRGVNSDRAVATLKARGLVEEAGQAETLGRPMLYRTTVRFLEYFGIERPDQLPPLPQELAAQELPL